MQVRRERMNKRSNLQKKGQKLLAFVLCLCMLLGSVNTTVFAADLGVTEKVADPSTANDWEQFFTPNSTENAGGVWTDKSVYENTTEMKEAIGYSVDVPMLDAENNFMVAMSALASNKEIVGYSTIPTDTILILDVSGSMDNSGSIPKTVQAANDAIKSLLELNKNNRVGVVLFSGNHNFGNSDTDDAMLLLGLNRYTANNSGQYLTYSGNNNTTVSIANNVRYENGQSVSTNGKSKQTEGGTYIQAGLDIAMETFLGADPVVEEDNVQSGETRMPIFVLMGDGAPTAATTSYTNIGNSNIGNGGSTNAGVGFVTQLTAAYARAQVENHYNTEAKFYTLGLNLAQQDSDGQYVANSVLDPENSINAIDTYWDNFFRNGSQSFNRPDNNRQVTVTRNINDGLTREDQVYVDKYFKADSNDDLEEAFASIVNEIIIQSAYYPTLVAEGGDLDLGGYVTFEDEIGQFMEVKNIAGLMLGDNRLYTGAALLKMMQSDEFGDRYTYTELGWELVESVAERIGVSQDVAISLLQQAWADGQLSYTSDTEFSNYIGWYEGANGEYIAYWNEDHTEADKPDGATYITRSYGFYGTSKADEKEVLGSDMMHIVVKVRKEISTGHEDVVFQVPASLIPTITYHVTLDADNFDDAEQITLTQEKDIKPVRLFFEVGLRDDINELNITEILAEENLVEGQHIHRNADGTYYFYSNQWGSTLMHEGGEIDYDIPFSHRVTVSHFHPSEVNEHYYYTEDTVILNADGTPYTGDSAPTGDNYYHALMYFKTTSGTNAEINYINEKISSITLAQHAKQAADGTWYIEKGSVYQIVDDFRTIKTENKTATLEYSDYPKTLKPNETKESYDVYDFLGNNGRIKITPATGIKLTKQVDDTITDPDAVFTFVIELKDANDNPLSGEYTLVSADGTYGKVTFTNGAANVSLKADETIYIIDLPAGAKYSVTENNANQDYKVASATLNGTDVNGTVVSGTITATELEKVVVTNTELKTGDLIIGKTVTHDFGSDYVIPTDKKFSITVTLTKDGAALVNTAIETTLGEKTTDAAGKITFELAHNESVKLTGLVEGTQYEVTETVPAGFTLTTTETTGTIAGNNTSEVALVNDYNPTSVPTEDLTIQVTKKLDGRDWDGDIFQFQFEKMAADGSWNKVDGPITVDSTTPFTFAIPANSLSTIGDHYFRIRELNPNSIPGITSDAARYITVKVVDDNLTGQLKIESITGNNITVGSNNESVSMEFVNKYSTTGEVTVSIPIEKYLINETGAEYGLNTFKFDLYSGTTLVEDNVLTNQFGDAEIHLKYTADQYEAAKDTNGVATFVYTLKEDSSENVPGMTYSDAEYTITVTLTSVDGVLQSSMSMVDKTGAEVSNKTAVFTNEYKLDPTNFTVTGTKTLTGRTINDNEFTFEMYKTGSDYAVSGDPVATVGNTGGAFSLTDTITTAGVHYYVIKEVGGSLPGVAYDDATYHVRVIATNDGNGGLTVKTEDILIVKVGDATGNGAVKFENSYEAAPTSIKISGTKQLTGKTLEQGMFEFALEDTSGNVFKAVNAANTGKFTFEAIEYTYDWFLANKGSDGSAKATYVIKEVSIAGVGYTNDDSSFEVTVTVTDNVGELAAVVSDIKEIDGADAEGVDAEVIFKNIYDPEDTEVKLSAKKLLENRLLTDNEYTFNVYRTDEDFVVPSGASAVASGKNAADGTVTFSAIPFDTTGTYYYVVKEDTSNKQMNVVYDTSEYQITVIVYDQGGQLSSHVSYAANGNEIGKDAVVFSNVYVEPIPATFPLEVTKNLTGRTLEAGEFDFELYEADSNFVVSSGASAVATGTNNASGEVYFDTNSATEDIELLTYHVADLGSATEKNFYYVIKEIIPSDKAGVVYDDSYFNVTIKVTDDGSGELIASVESIVEVDGNDTDTADNSAVVFNNTYTAQPTTITFGGTKTLSDKNLTVGEYTFELYKTDSTYSTTGLTALQSKPNAADGTYSFDVLTFSGEETHYYVIKEKDGGDDKVTYDQTVYQIKVDVKDNGEGSYVYDVTYGNVSITDAAAKSILDFNFENKYNPDDAVLNISGTKTLEGRDMVDGEFEFALYETGSNYKVSGDAKQVKTNKDGKFTFDSLVFDKEDTYYYVVEEVVPDDKEGVDYDKTSYEIKVVVENNNEGKLIIDVTCGSDKYTDKEVVELTNADFKNTYTSKLPDGIALGLVGQKYMTGDRTTVEAKEFEFVLYEVTVDKDGKETVTEIDRVKNDKTGAFAFEPMDDYTVAGVYNYRVVEEASDAIGMTYDASVYNVAVTVEDDGKGNLIIKEPVYTVDGKVSRELAFTNTYNEPDPISVTFDITKLLENKTDKVVGLDGFEFKLTTGLFGSTVATVKTDANGKAAFTMTYTMDDIGETYNYKISEVNTGIGGMKYDKDKVKVSVSITEENGVLKATVTQDDKAVSAVKAQFTNEYVGVPVTGDMANPALWMSVVVVALGAVALMLYFRRRRA